MRNFKVEYKNYRYATGFCPHHDDTNTPNLKITLQGEYRGAWRCWACGKYGVLTEEQMKKLDLDGDKMQGTKKPNSIDWGALVTLYLENEFVSKKADTLLKEWRVDKINLNMGWDGESHTIPMMDEDGRTIGIQRRWPHAVKGNKCCVDGSRLGLFIPHKLWRSCEGSVLVCEGASDTAVAVDLGFPAIGRPSCNSCQEMVFKWCVNNLINNILIVADNDKAGITGAIALETYLINNGMSKGINGVEVYIPTAKDLREEARICGKDMVREVLQVWLDKPFEEGK